MKNTRSIVLTALFLAIGLALPPLVRLIPGAGVMISPMHIPVLTAGITVGPVSGFITGLLCPVLNYFIGGNMKINSLISMSVELPVYGLVSGVLMKVSNKHSKHEMVNVYVSLIIAMIAGRIAGGFMQGVVLGTEGYSLAVWVSAYFIATLPGIIIQLIVIPAVYYALKKAGMIKAYQK